MTQREIPQAKLKAVEELKSFIEGKRTILLASIKNIPGSQFQEISKKLRGKAVVKVPKKNLMLRALDASNKEEIKGLKEQIENSVAILFSDLDSFELAADLSKNTSPAKAKPGQESPEDILIEEGPTELLPGPAITELGSVGLEVQIEKGKIHIRKSKVIVKKGEKISQNAADVMNKLDIKPFKIGFIPLAAFDNKDNKLYLEIKIDSEGTLAELKSLFGKALALAVEVNYANKDTITFMLAKANAHEKALSNLMDTEESKSPEEPKGPEEPESEEAGSEKKEEDKTEEVKEEKEVEKKEDNTQSEELK
jgi:large subunit ribosomal protein L10